MAPLELIPVESLMWGVRWEHRLGANGVSTNLTLADGRHINSDAVRGVLNRCTGIPIEPTIIRPDDYEYALQEFHAFFASWLYGLPQPVFNRPYPPNLSGQWRHVSQWIILAAKSGLPTRDYTQDSRAPSDDIFMNQSLFPSAESRSTVIVIDGVPISTHDIPSHILEGCVHLSELAETAILGVDLVYDPSDGWTFVDSTPWPDLRQGGERLLDALDAALRRRVEL